MSFSSTAVDVKSSKNYGLFALVVKHIACAQAIATIIPVKLPEPFVTAT